MAMKAHVTQVSLDPNEVDQTIVAYPGWGYIQASARYDAENDKVLIFVGYAWHDPYNPWQGDIPNPFDAAPSLYRVHVYPVGVDFDFDQQSSTIGMVRVGDGTFRYITAGWEALPLPPEEEPEPEPEDPAE